MEEVQTVRRKFGSCTDVQVLQKSCNDPSVIILATFPIIDGYFHLRTHRLGEALVVHSPDPLIWKVLPVSFLSDRMFKRIVVMRTYLNYMRCFPAHPLGVVSLRDAGEVPCNTGWLYNGA